MTDETESTSFLLSIMLQAVMFILLLAAGLFILSSLGSSQTNPKSSFDSFKTLLSDACKSADLSGEIFDFKLAPNHLITQFYLATDRASSVYRTDTVYGENKGYETFDYGSSCTQNGGTCVTCSDSACNDECAPNLWYPGLQCCANGQNCLQACCIPKNAPPLNPAASAQSGLIVTDLRNTRLVDSGVVGFRDAKLIESCSDRVCVCLIKYNGCPDVSARGGYAQYISDIVDHAYPDYPGSIKVDTMSFEDDLDYAYIGTKRARDISGCSSLLGGAACKRNVLQLLDGATRQFFSWRACEDEVRVVDCAPLEAFGCSAKKDSYGIEDAPIMVDQGEYYGLSALPAAQYAGGLSISYMKIHKSSQGYLIIGERVRG